MPRDFIPPGVLRPDFTFAGTNLSPFVESSVGDDFVSKLPTDEELGNADPRTLSNLQAQMQVLQIENWANLNARTVYRVGQNIGVLPEGMPGFVAYGEQLPSLVRSIGDVANAARGKGSPYQVTQLVLNSVGDTLNALDNILQVAAFASAVPVVGWVLNVVEGMFQMAAFTAGVIKKWGIGTERKLPYRQPIRFVKDLDEAEAQSFVDYLASDARDYTDAFIVVENPQGIALWRLEEGSRTDKYLFDIVAASGSSAGGAIIPGFGERLGAFQAWLTELDEFEGGRLDTCEYQYLRPQCGNSWRNPIQSTSEFYPSANVVGNDIFNRIFSASPTAFFIDRERVLRNWEAVMEIYARPTEHFVNDPMRPSDEKEDPSVRDPMDKTGPWTIPAMNLADMTGSIWVAPDAGKVLAYQTPVGLATQRGDLGSDDDFSTWLLDQLNSNNNSYEIDALTTDITTTNAQGYGIGTYSRLVRDLAQQNPPNGYNPQSEGRPNTLLPVPFGSNERILQCSHMWYIWWVFEKHQQWLERLSQSTTAAYVSENDIAIATSNQLRAQIMDTRQRILGSLRDLIYIEPELIPDNDYRQAVAANRPPPETLFAQQEPATVPTGPDAVFGLKAPKTPIPSPRPPNGGGAPSGVKRAKGGNMGLMLAAGGALALLALARR